MVNMPQLEKLTINLTPVDVGKIELLVEQGFYANRAEFIRAAITSELTRHADTVKAVATRESIVIGAMMLARATLEKRSKARKPRLAIRVVGFLSIAADVSPELARQTIGSLSVRGIFRASQPVKDALADRVE